MKYLVLLVLMAGGPVLSLLTRVRDRNVAVATGMAAYTRGDASRAAAAFSAALEARAQRVPDPKLVLNLAHAQTQQGQDEEAKATYARLLSGSHAKLTSVARQQLAVLAAQQGEIAQALGLLRQALVLDPTNSSARFDYEVLSDYLAKRPNSPKISPPSKGAESKSPKHSPEKNGADKTQPAEKAGTDRQGKTNDSKPAPGDLNTPPQPQNAPNGRPDTKRPNATPGSAAPGGRAPGRGAAQPIASGEAPGNRRGLDRNSAAPAMNGLGNRPGADDATPADLRLQTQRERLQAMNLSPAQARQLLETLRAQEQQYLQQLTRPAPQKPDPSKPTW